jgi:hypothetical protein
MGNPQKIVKIRNTGEKPAPDEQGSKPFFLVRAGAPDPVLLISNPALGAHIADLKLEEGSCNISQLP